MSFASHAGVASYVTGGLQTERVGEKQTEKSDQGGEKGKSSYVSDQLECMEFLLGMDEESTKSLGVTIKGRAGADGIIVGGLL